MKKTLLSIMACTSCYTFAFLGGGTGGVVTDPKSYTYYTAQIDHAIEQVKIAEQQIKKATETYEMVTSIDDNITGNLQRAQRYAKKIKDLKENFDVGDVRKSLIYAKRAITSVGEIPEYQEDIEKNINDTFGVETEKRNDWVSVEAERKASKQKALKQAVIDAETAKGKIDLQLESLEELTTATNTTDSLKDASDTTNTILIEMLEAQHEIIKLLASISQNIALADYEGDESLSGDNFKKHSGRSMTDKSDWQVESPTKNKKTSDCDPFTNSGCDFIDGEDNPFENAWN